MLHTCIELGSHFPCVLHLKGNSQVGIMMDRGNDGSNGTFALSNHSKSHCLPAFCGENSSGSNLGNRYVSSIYAFIDSGVSLANAGG